MKFISIGEVCNVKHQIDKHIEKTETLFFDWIGTDMKSIIDILNCENIEIYLNKENIIQDPNNMYVFNNSRVYLKSLSKCVFIHDLSKNFDDDELNKFIQKYKNRFLKFINIIKSNDDLFFIRYGKINEDEKNSFIQTILKINNNCNFYLVCISLNNDKEEIYHFDKFIKFNLMHIPIQNDWTTSFIDWFSIFEYLKNI